MAAIKLQLAEFSAVINEAKRTTEELQNQLKMTEGRALKAEAENLKSRQEIDILTTQLQEKRSRNKSLDKGPRHADATHEGEEENNEDTHMGGAMDSDHTSSDYEGSGGIYEDDHDHEDEDMDMDNDVSKSKAGKVRCCVFFSSSLAS